MSDSLRENIIALMADTVARGVRSRVNSPRKFKHYRSPHPALNPRSGIQTFELPLEDYKAIAERATQLLKESGFNVTVTYDESDDTRAFMADLR